MDKVSIIMPAHNAARYIEKAIQSVIMQTYIYWELIVIDDASQDKTAEVVQKLSGQDVRILFYQNLENLGVAATRNRGIEIASGNYIAFLDSDDIWGIDKLKHQLWIINERSADLCYTAYFFISESENKIGKSYHVPLSINYQQLLQENVIGCSTVLLRTNLMKSSSFSVTYFHEDYILWLELLRKGCVAVGINEPLVRYRTGGRSSNKLKAAKNRWIIYREIEKLSTFDSLVCFTSYCLRAVCKYAFMWY